MIIKNPKRPWMPERKPFDTRNLYAVDERYHSTAWRKGRNAYIKEHPLCVECAKKGIEKLAEVVDHIIPVKEGGDFWDANNWQSLCKHCNQVKGNKSRAKNKR